MHDTDQFLEVSDARLRYRLEGPGPTLAPAVVLVHGWALDLDMWQPQLAALADEFTVIAMDRRGFGLSSGRPALGRDAEDIAALLDAVGIDDISIVGMSQGARVALDWARRFADRTRSLVLDAPPPLLATSAEIPMDEYRQLVAHEGMPALRDRWLRHELMQLRTPDEPPRELLRRIVARYPGHDVRAPSPAPPIDPAAIDAPTLVLSGEHDTEERQAAAAEFAAVLPNAERRVVAGAGHLSNLDDPQQYDLLLREFLRRHADGARPSHPRPSEFEPCSTG